MDNATCPECGKSIKLGWKCCPICGAKIERPNATCPEGGEPIKSDWKCCPECGARIEKARENVVPASGSFTCPGCGEKSGAKNGLLCGSCKAFVHHECLVKGKEIEDNRLYECLCPICKAVLGEAEYHEGYGEFIKIAGVTPQLNEKNVMDKDRHLLIKFTCPGCGETSNAKTGWLCKTCRAFVHDGCLLPGPATDEGPGWWPTESPELSWEGGLCPVCQQTICNGYFAEGEFYRTLKRYLDIL